MATSTGRGPGLESASPPSVGRGVELLAGRAVGGSVDAAVVLVLRAVRRLWVPALVLGIAWLVATGDAEAASAGALDTVGELLSALLTPLAGIALAVAVRLLTGMLGWLAAVPRARAELLADGDGHGAVVRRSADLLFLTGALRSLRFTAAARDVAAHRLGAFGRVALTVDRVETWLVPASALTSVVVLAVAGIGATA